MHQIIAADLKRKINKISKQDLQIFHSKKLLNLFKNIKYVVRN